MPECVGLVSDQQIKALAGAEVAAMPLQALVGDERHRVPRRARRDEEMKSVNHCQIGRRPLEHGHVERVRRAAKPLAKLLRSGKTDRDRQCSATQRLKALNVERTAYQLASRFEGVTMSTRRT